MAVAEGQATTDVRIGSSEAERGRCGRARHMNGTALGSTCRSAKTSRPRTGRTCGGSAAIDTAPVQKGTDRKAEAAGTSDQFGWTCRLRGRALCRSADGSAWTTRRDEGSTHCPRWRLGRNYRRVCARPATLRTARATGYGPLRRLPYGEGAGAQMSVGSLASAARAADERPANPPSARGGRVRPFHARDGEQAAAGLELGHDGAECGHLLGAEQHRLGPGGRRRRHGPLRRPVAALATRLANARLGRSGRLDVLDAVLAQQPLHALDGVAGVLQEIADAAQKLHVGRPVEAAPAAALHGLELRELQLPEAQHVLLDAELDRHLADVAKCLQRLCQGQTPL